jgi:O-acetyl-ADP-ribose deacetylase (regulator of RNase III)
MPAHVEPGFRLILVDPDPALCLNWRQRFAQLPHVEVVNGVFQELPEFDCMISAANSFGIMDGGVDLAIVQFFGRNLERRVRQRILTEWHGEQPVGTSMIVETGHARHPFLAHTPTMRVPRRIDGTDAPYRAMWAMLLAVHRHNQSGTPPIRAVACPGLGTGVGHVPFPDAARQMALAWRNFLHPPDAITWHFATERAREVGW